MTATKRYIWVVEWLGMFGTLVYREFDTRERAEQWARQCGRFRDCTIRRIVSAEPRE